MDRFCALLFKPTICPTVFRAISLGLSSTALTFYLHISCALSSLETHFQRPRFSRDSLHQSCCSLPASFCNALSACAPSISSILLAASDPLVLFPKPPLPGSFPPVEASGPCYSVLMPPVARSLAPFSLAPSLLLHPILPSLCVSFFYFPGDSRHQEPLPL